MSNDLYIGWGEADITPAHARIELAGQYYQRLATGIHSRLKAVAFALQRDDEQAILISLDVVGLPEELQQRLGLLIHAQLPEVASESVLLNAIHTHNAPYTRPSGLFRDWLPLDETAIKPADYLEFLERQVLAAARQAWESRRPGGLASAFAAARLGHCRRAVYADGSAEMYGDTSRPDFVGMEAGEDSGVELLFTFDAAGTPQGVVVNVACPSQVMESTYLISSDFMGATREKLKQTYGEHFQTLCQVSAAGCQSPRDLVRGRRSEPDFWHADGVEVLAGRLHQAVVEGMAQAAGTISHTAAFSHTCRRVTLPLRRATYADYRQARANLERLLAAMPEKEAFADFCRETHANEAIAGRPGPYDSKLHPFVLIQNNKAVIKRYETQESEPGFSFDMHALRLGECAMISNPFELYLVYGQMIKARAQARQTFVVQLAGGTGGYLPSREAEQFGGYGGLIINGRVGADGGQLLVDLAVADINALFPAS